MREKAEEHRLRRSEKNENALYGELLFGLVTAWIVAPSTLSRLLPPSSRRRGIPPRSACVPAPHAGAAERVDGETHILCTSAPARRRTCSASLPPADSHRAPYTFDILPAPTSQDVRMRTHTATDSGDEGGIPHQRHATPASTPLHRASPHRMRSTSPAPADRHTTPTPEIPVPENTPPLPLPRSQIKAIRRGAASSRRIASTSVDCESAIGTIGGQPTHPRTSTPTWDTRTTPRPLHSHSLRTPLPAPRTLDAWPYTRARARRRLPTPLLRPRGSAFLAAPVSASASAHAHTHPRPIPKSYPQARPPPPPPVAEETYPAAFSSLALPCGPRPRARSARAQVDFPSAHAAAHMGAQDSGSRRGWRLRRARVCCHEVAVAVERVVFCADGIVRVAGISNELPARVCAPGPAARSYNAPEAIPRNRSTSAARRHGREVVLLEPVPTPLAAADSTASRPASKADGLHADVLALPPLSGIKLRVSAGVLEMTLIRVLEERCSVAVPFVARGRARALVSAHQPLPLDRASAVPPPLRRLLAAAVAPRAHPPLAIAQRARYQFTNGYPIYETSPHHRGPSVFVLTSGILILRVLHMYNSLKVALKVENTKGYTS
ncbi:hypothetical protein B0H11DRAFT_2259300 [Mycena galericulata]|nr:hypothetical protein B0H11DRAFT_2259300 [Mycena galericulata]